jgi:tRNA(fMet)-specific endonuclease VapC
MDYLIDTNICIYIMNHRPPAVIRKFKEFEPGRIGVSSITVSELEYGAAKSAHPRKNRSRLSAFLLPLDILDYDEKAAEAYGTIRTDLEKRGQTIGPLDFLIAAQALSRGLVLVTNNDREFGRIKGLTVENWVETTV